MFREENRRFPIQLWYKSNDRLEHITLHLQSESQRSEWLEAIEGTLKYEAQLREAISKAIDRQVDTDSEQQWVLVLNKSEGSRKVTNHSAQYPESLYGSESDSSTYSY